VPRLIEFRTDLPRNPAGKPLKRVLRAEQAPASPGTPSGQESR
jgi:acyl-CoA synthetase (AMP-forming)/AMP-acid ligase II